ncbi:MAG: hypothetical protein PUD73_03105 [bacterium]|nr:hypothetical protein [bacterium]
MAINRNYQGLISTMRNAVHENMQLKAADFDSRDDFSAYKLSVYFVQKDLSRLAACAKRGDFAGVEAAKTEFYKSFKRLMTGYFAGDGEQYVASNAEAEAYLPHVGSFRKDPDGNIVFVSAGEASFRKAFERTVIHRIDGGMIRTAEEMRAAREAKAAAKKAAAKAAKEAAKQEKPDPKPEEIDVYADKKKQEEAKVNAAA